MDTSYKKVKAEVEKACLDNGRDKNAVVLEAVSKTHPYEAVLAAYAEGARIFGENRVQEVMAKFPLPPDRPEGMILHLIGHLQKNKVKKIVPLVDMIESVDSIELLREIDKASASCGKVMDILFEINTSQEEQKSGFTNLEEFEEALLLLPHLTHVKAKGLMSVGPLGNDENANRKAFLSLYDLFIKHPEQGFTVLSMGMSGDFHTAIACHSTQVRIGTAIFGQRDYGQTTH